ncbi:DNA polymerase I [Neomegalonema sp.]|uniref:DNA polymerase I n=1 Tax=Neomegalonema sp. TaxID=2039713 RepID=UPI002619D7F9|nr:DNA polymerase I [Neomegalonema sp.]MDD2866951.1 DNA polymerase I [Neomegalonema sp.]
MAAPVDATSHLYLIDGSGFIFRAFHALPGLTRKSDGLPTGAVSGFCNMLWKLVDDAFDGDGVGPTHLLVAFDVSRVSFRNEIYADYKAHRPPPPEALIPQFPLIRRAAEAFNLPGVELEGFEADDLIASYAQSAAALGAKVTIVSSDKDLMQLVGGKVALFDPMKEKAIGPREVEEKFGVPPERVIDVQALAGDASDNVPGAPGIGLKTAAQLILEYGDLDQLLARAGEIKQPKRRESLIENAEQIQISRKLVTLDRKAPQPLALEDLGVRPPDPAKLLEFLREMEFATLAKRAVSRFGEAGEGGLFVRPRPAPEPMLEDEAPPAPEDPALFAPFDGAGYKTLSTEGELSAWIERAKAQGFVALDLETTSLDEMQAEIVGVALALAPGEAAYLPLGHVEGEDDLFGSRRPASGQMAMEAALALLKPLCEDDSVLKIGQNLKYDLKVLANYGIGLAPIDDTMLMSYALGSGEGRHGLEALMAAHLGQEGQPIQELIGSGKKQIGFAQVPVEKAARYAAEDADAALRLALLLKPRLWRKGLATVYETLERPIIPVLAAMEREGILVDKAALARMSGDFARRMAAYEAEIHQLAGREFNLASPKQLGEILFEEMGLPGGRKTKTGAWSTDVEALDELAADHALAARILDWRQLAKLKSTYADALVEHVDPRTGRVHTSFSLAATSTGRLASTDPNLQNIPIRTEEGRAIRRAFVAPEGCKLVSLDYSQIELRILAHVADVPALREAFAEGRDIHAITAARVFGLKLEEVTPELRRRAKAVNFGVIYGSTAHGLARQLGVGRSEAQIFIDAYFAEFPGIKAYMERTISEAKRKGYVETIFGRRILASGVGGKGAQRGAAERAAINAPIQGAAADVIRRAMIRVPPALAASGLRAKMLLQVHDELIFEAPEAEVEALIALVRPIMERADEPVVKLAAPLVVEAGSGANWAEAH